MYRILTRMPDGSWLPDADIYDSVEAALIDIHLFIADYRRHHPEHPDDFSLDDFKVEAVENGPTHWRPSHAPVQSPRHQA